MQTRQEDKYRHMVGNYPAQNKRTNKNGERMIQLHQTFKPQLMTTHFMAKPSNKTWTLLNPMLKESQIDHVATSQQERK